MGAAIIYNIQSLFSLFIVCGLFNVTAVIWDFVKLNIYFFSRVYIKAVAQNCYKTHKNIVTTIFTLDLNHLAPGVGHSTIYKFSSCLIENTHLRYDDWFIMLLIEIIWL